MATAAVEIPQDRNRELPSHNRVEPGSFQLPIAQLPAGDPNESVNAEEVVRTWLKVFQDILSTQQWQNLSKLFLPEAYWRDQLCLSWNFRMC